MYHYLTLLCCCITFTGYAQELSSQEITSTHFKRFFKVSDSIYRSEQPNKKGFTTVAENGIKTVLNLRRTKENTKKAKHTDLVLHKLSLKAKDIDQAAIINALKLINDAEKPVLVHCWHGSDRTGVVIAAYRVIFDNWTKAQAIAEFRRPEFNYHEQWYPNLIDIINDLEVEKIRNLLGI
jgi:protein tyrosine/serine phosphatase